MSSLRNQSIVHMKLSELCEFESSERTLLRITGNADPAKSTPKELVLFSAENSRRLEAVVDLTNLGDFSISDINIPHDLVQFIGYKDLTLNQFRALHYRLIRRTTTDTYYKALDLQRSYLSAKLQN